MSVLEDSEEQTYGKNVHNCHFCPDKTEFLSFNCEESAPEIYHCHDCNFKTDLLVFFKKHVSQIHLTRNEKIVEYTLQHFVCQNCTFGTYSSLQWLKHVKIECPSIEEIQQEESDDQKIPCKKSQKWYMCKHCLYKTKSEKVLSLHMRMTHDENLYECCDCDFTTHSKIYLRTHIIQRHTPAEKFLYCDQCSYRTMTTTGLTRHKQNRCSARKQIGHELNDKLGWKCDYCEYKSKWKGQLTRHVRNTHVKWKDTDFFHCDNCFYKAKTKRDLRIHNMRVHLASEEIQWLQCEKCSYKTKTKNDLGKHNKRIHLPHEKNLWFQCDKCTFKTKNETTLNTHNVRLHLASEQIQWFQCDKCFFKSKYRSCLNRHNKSRHLGPFLPSSN